MTRSHSPSLRPAARGQVDPAVALICLLGVCLGVSLYAVVLADSAVPADRSMARPTLDRIADAVGVAGVAAPERLAAAVRTGAAGYAVNVTLVAGEGVLASVDADGDTGGPTRFDDPTLIWSAGQAPPRGSTRAVETAHRAIGVRVAPGRVLPGRLRVAVWEETESVGGD